MTFDIRRFGHWYMVLEGKDYLGCKRNYLSGFPLTLLNQRFDFEHCVLSMDVASLKHFDFDKKHAFGRV